MMKEYITADAFLATLPEDLQREVEEGGGEQLVAQYALETIRGQAHLTQQDVASRLGVSQAEVCSLEERYAEATVSTLKLYCDAVGAEMTISIKAQDGTTYALP